MMTPTQIAMKKARRNFIVGLIAATVAVNSIILLAPDAESKSYLGDLIQPMVAAVAAGLALVVVYRQKTSGIFGRAYAALAAGLGFYFIAEFLWAYYSLGLGIEVPFPSLADAFWLSAYAPFGYGLFTLSRLYSKRAKRGGNSHTKALVVMGIAVAAFSSYYVMQLVSVSDLSAPDAGIALVIGIAYPVMDAILLIPALFAIISAGRGYLTSIPWIFVSWLFTALADSIFGFTAVTSMAADVTIWNMYYVAAYLSMAAGMLWHNKYMIFDSKLEIVIPIPPSPPKQ